MKDKLIIIDEDDIMNAEDFICPNCESKKFTKDYYLDKYTLKAIIISWLAGVISTIIITNMF